jgi:malate/lactate dehydrogenase
VKLGANGVEEIFEVPLTDEEKALVARSAAAVKSSIEELGLGVAIG